ncbi:solute carrier family 15 member 2, partial [Nephila pilipes]
MGVHISKKSEKETRDPDNEQELKDEEMKPEDKVEPMNAQILAKFPKAVFFLVGNEFCERFSYYGMRTILTLYLIDELNFSSGVSTRLYHTFQIIAYFTPIFGAIMADSWLGRYRTILYVSILYACGNIIVAIGAIPHRLTVMRVMSIIGLSIIGIGTGGIKPCVSAFGGDQFNKGQEKMRHHFFALFYFAINSGSLLSTALTPILRADVKCFGKNTCFFAAFLVPAIFFVIALILFLFGKSFYVIKPAEGSVIVSVCRCIGYALYNKAVKKGEKKKHWLDYADDQYDTDLINDVKHLFSVLIILLPLPIFWALYEQQGSRWVLQGTQMDGEILSSFYIQPDHMQIINPLLILVLIPVFDWIIYPALERIKLCSTPLQRMTVGGLLCAFSFIVTACIQLIIETEIPKLPPEGESEMLVINNSPCSLEMRSPHARNLSSYS